MTSHAYPDILPAVGRTPLVKLKRLVPPGGATALAKVEFLNPSGSVKDRIAKYIIAAAEREGRLRPGGTLVEATTGNTGVALAMVAAARGYPLLVTMPENMSAEKGRLLRAYGAEVVLAPADVPPDSSEHYRSLARRLAAEIPGAFFVNQYFSARNAEAHYRTTGPEIWDQAGGRLDYVVAGVGTGGTLSGVARYLKEREPRLRALAVDPAGSVLYDYIKTGRAGEAQPYEVEGIGQDEVVGALEVDVVDDVVRVDDASAFRYARRLASEEGLLAGGSSGAAVAAAVRLAEDLPPEKVIVTILPDAGGRYLSTIYADGMAGERRGSLCPAAA